MSRHGISGPLTVLIAILSVSPANGQNRLASVKGLSCVFTLVTSGTWKNGEPQVETRPASLSIRFESVNIDEASAQAVGQFGPSDVIVKLSSGTLHLVQSFREGPIYVTTVFASESRPGKWKAVHTRHEYTAVSIPGFTSTPEQYYGACELAP